MLLGVKLLISIGVLVYFAWRAGFSGRISLPTSISIPAFTLAVGLFALQTVTAAARWGSILAATGASLSASRTAATFYAGAFFNTFLPGAVAGDLLRIWETRLPGGSLARAANSVLLDRGTALLALVVTTLALFPTYLVLRLGGTLRSALPYVGMPVALLLVALVALVLVPKAPANRYLAYYVELVMDARKLLLTRSAGPVLLFTLAAQLLLSIAVYPLAGQAGVSLTLFECMALTPPVFLISALPISLGGWGVREAAMVVVLGRIGVPEAQAFLLSVLVGLAAAVAALPGGLCWLLLHRKRALSASL